MPKSRRSALFLTCAAILAVAASGCGGSKKTELVLRAQARGGEAPTAADMARSLRILERRARLLDHSADVRRSGSRTVVVRIAGSSEARAARLLTTRGGLAFYDLEADLAAPSLGRSGRVKPFGSLRALLRAAGRQSVPPHRVVVTCGRADAVCPGVGKPKRTYYYLFKYEPAAKPPIPEMTGRDVAPSGTRADFDPQTNQPVVLIQLTNAGQLEFEKITAHEANRGAALWRLAGGAGSAENYFQSFAIVLDGTLESFPTIDFQQYPNGINAANGIQITGLRGGIDAAENLANVLQTGELPVPFSVAAK